MNGMIDEAIPTARPLTTTSRSAAYQKVIGSPLSRTTRMPSICLPQVWPLCAPSRAIGRRRVDQRDARR